MNPERRLATLGLVLPAATRVPPGVRLPFAMVHVVAERVLVSGHGPTNPDGTIAAPLGKVGTDVTLEQAYEAARRTALAIFASLKRALGELERVEQWVRVFGMVNAAPGFDREPEVLNGFSDLVLEVWGDVRGQHARSAIGVAELPFRIPVEIEAEVLIRR